MKLKGVELKGEYIIRYQDDSFSVFDKNNNKIYYENSDGFWVKREFNKNNNEIYYEASNGVIEDNRPIKVKKYTVAELEKILGETIEIVSEKE
ncbi:MAG: hypothetical protein KQ78_01828 [Candidatus Izimaplasma bacterium HR2]|nr:MAG: hypothetical protein KQ78_01828 [Candidatus Izimaplasma bacterium HR2]